MSFLAGTLTQVRAFALYSKAREGAGHVTAEEAIRQAQAVALSRVGRGGLGEEATARAAEEAGGHLMLGAGRRDDAVARTGAGLRKEAAAWGLGTLRPSRAAAVRRSWPPFHQGLPAATPASPH
jgi:hypothetical protein